jgi:hypothetical protein
MNQTAMNTVMHLSVIIGLSAIVVTLIIINGKEFKEDYKAWKGDKRK